MSGVTPQGFVVKTLNEIRADVESSLRADLGADINLSADSVLGLIVGSVCAQLSTTWEAMAQLAHTLDPLQAVAQQLDDLARFNGIVRRQAQPAVGSIDVTGMIGTIIPAGALVRDPTAQVNFEVSASTQIVAPTTAVPVQAVVAGEINSLADGITQIVTPVAGWTAIVGSAVSRGQERETDDQLRARILTLGQTGLAVDGAIARHLADLEPVQQVSVVSNRTDTDLPGGLPRKSFQAIIYPDLTGQPAAEQEIASTIFRTQPAGVRSWGGGVGGRTAEVLDRFGNIQTVGWRYVQTVPVDVLGWITIDATVTGASAAQVKAQAEEIILDLVNGLNPGQDVTMVSITSALFAAIPGVADAWVQLARNGDPIAPNNIPIEAFEKASLDPSALVVAVTISI